MLGFGYALIVEKQFVILSIVSVIYLGLIFGIDKFKIDLKNKKVELADTNQVVVDINQKLDKDENRDS